MAVDINSVAYMKEYLKYALEFEKYVYIWTKAMDEANARMRQIYNEKNQLESVITTATDTRYSDVLYQQKSFNQKELSKYKKKSKNVLTFIIVFLLILFVVGAGIGIVSGGASNVVLLPLYGIGTMFGGFFLTGIGPVSMWLYFSNKKKADALAEKAKRDYSEDSTRRQRMIIEAKSNNASQNLTIVKNEALVTESRQNEIFTALNTAKKNLAEIYSMNVLPYKYRNLNAVATMYEYLETRRCNTIAGHGGIYDTYEVERIQLEQLQQMIQMNQRLANIEDYQRYICQELSKANRILSDISSCLNNIEKTNREIAKNTAISAEANKQTAAATSYLAWRAWANGY